MYRAARSVHDDSEARLPDQYRNWACGPANPTGIDVDEWQEQEQHTSAYFLDFMRDLHEWATGQHVSICNVEPSCSFPKHAQRRSPLDSRIVLEGADIIIIDDSEEEEMNLRDRDRNEHSPSSSASLSSRAAMFQTMSFDLLDARGSDKASSSNDSPDRSGRTLRPTYKCLEAEASSTMSCRTESNTAFATTFVSDEEFEEAYAEDMSVEQAVWWLRGKGLRDVLVIGSSFSQQGPAAMRSYDVRFEVEDRWLEVRAWDGRSVLEYARDLLVGRM